MASVGMGYNPFPIKKRNLHSFENLESCAFQLKIIANLNHQNNLSVA